MGSLKFETSLWFWYDLVKVIPDNRVTMVQVDVVKEGLKGLSQAYSTAERINSDLLSGPNGLGRWLIT